MISSQKNSAFWLISCLLTLLPIVNATPAFNTVNGWHVNGTKCSLPTYYAYPCPAICVRDVSQCPEQARPSCPAGQTWCVDGSCRDSCPSDLTSSCSCPGAPSLEGGLVYPCAEVHVNIENFDAANKLSQTEAVCAQYVGISDIQPWNPNPQSIMSGQCPTPDYGTLTFSEPIFIALYTFYGSCVFFLATWAMYKFIREKAIKARYHQVKELKRDSFSNGEKKDKEGSLNNEKLSRKSSTDSSSSIHTEEQDEMIVKAYKRDYFGIFVSLLYILQTMGMIAFMIVLVYDYYQNYLYFRGDALVQSSTFIGMWYVFFIWFATLTVFRNRLSNFFRIQCTYPQAHYVQVERMEPSIIFLEDEDKVMAFVRHLEKTAKRMFGLDVVVNTAPLQKTGNGTKFFVYQCTRYVYHPETQLFKPHHFELGEKNSDLAVLNKGLTSQEAMEREELIGPNFIEVYVPSIPMAILREFASFFYIYQFTALWLFYYFAYWQVGIADTAVILVSAFVKVVVRLKSEIRIKKMAEFTDTIKILRDGKWVEVSTADLVPGDVFEVMEGKTAPCDAVVLTGNIVADESSLTGEPLPIRKFPLRKNDPTPYDSLGAGKISTIYAGTIISQAQRTEHDTPVTALVTNTGTATDKGELVKKILFPTRVSFIFDEQIKIVILILLCCGLVCLGLAIWLYTSGTSAWFYAMFAICQLVSPLLPAALVVGQSVAAGRLRKKNIFCVDLPRILMAGKVQLFCFDKTGTLTKEGLEFYGGKPVTNIDRLAEQREGNSEPEFDDHIEAVEDIPRLMQIGLATCHAVTILNGQFIGNPVDIEMFRSSKWKLSDEPHDEAYVDTLTPPMEAPGQISAPVHVLKRFEFVHARMSMSVAVLDTHTNKVHIFVKGAYEKIKDLCHPESIPKDYDSVTAGLARQGCYVLALAHRELHLDEVGGMEGFRNWNRDQMEEDINFAGLVIFKNQLKEDTTENIHELKRGATRTIMITGDTALTGVYIARQCGMATEGARVLLGDLDKSKNRIVWTDVDEPETFPDVNVDEALLNQAHTPCELAVTGKAFDWLCENDMMRKYLLDTRVFARMTPAGKVLCVQLHMERGITAMTGDGGNDCGALRAAHVGIAMSDAEASIVSPFSTSHRSVRSCVELIRQGRGALATSITNYKYLIMYGQVMMMLKIFTFYFSVTMNQYVWLAIDVLITVLLTWAVSQSHAATRLEGQRPTARLLGPQTLASTMGLVLINWLFLIGAFVMLFKQDWYRCNEFDASAVDISKWWLLADNYEAQMLAIVCLFQFINNAAIFNYGYKFRKSWWRNYSLVFLWLLYFAIVSYWTLADPNQFGCLFRINCGTPEVLEQIGYQVPPVYIEPYNVPLGHNVMPWDFRWKLWGLCVGNMAAGLIYEKLVVIGPVHSFLAKRYPVDRLQVKK